MSFFSGLLRARRPSRIIVNETMPAIPTCPAPPPPSTPMRPSQEVVDSVVRENLALKRENTALKARLMVQERRMRELL